MYYRHKSNVLKLEVSTSQLEGALQPEGSALPLKGSGLQLEGSFLQLERLCAPDKHRFNDER